MADVLANLKDWSATASSNLPSGATTIGTGLDDNLRQIQATLRQDLAAVGANIASAATCDLGAIAGLFHTITGTTGITSFGTVSAGIWKILTFSGALTITHNATSLICPGAEDITTVAGYSFLLESLGSGNWKVHSGSKVPLAILATTATTATNTTGGLIAGKMGAGTGSANMVGIASINTTVVGNIGAGTDDLMSYTLPADSLSADGKAIRIKCWGLTANNANAKSLAFNFGATSSSTTLTPSIAGFWFIDVTFIRTSANNQSYSIHFSEFLSGALGTPKASGGVGTLALTDTGSIVLKVTAIGVSDNDIVQKQMIVEYLN
mgnify:CR=1 FL=1